MSKSKFKPEEESDSPKHMTAGELLSATYTDLNLALNKSVQGISSRIHQLDQTVTFILDNHQEVVLRVRKLEIEHAQGQVLSFNAHCRTDFENVLILAKKLKMRISAFSAYFTVILTARPDFVEEWNDAIIGMKHPAQFFETLDELKRPIFLNLNHYIFSRISD